MNRTSVVLNINNAIFHSYIASKLIFCIGSTCSEKSKDARYLASFGFTLKVPGDSFAIS